MSSRPVLRPAISTRDSRPVRAGRAFRFVALTLALCGIGLGLSACGSSNGPGDVAKAAYIATAKNDCKALVKLIETPSDDDCPTSKILPEKQFSKSKEQKAAARGDVDIKSVEDYDTRDDGIKVKKVTLTAGGAEQIIHVVDIDGEWKVESKGTRNSLTSLIGSFIKKVNAEPEPDAEPTSDAQMPPGEPMDKMTEIRFALSDDTVLSTMDVKQGSVSSSDGYFEDASEYGWSDAFDSRVSANLVVLEISPAEQRGVADFWALMTPDRKTPLLTPGSSVWHQGEEFSVESAKMVSRNDLWSELKKPTSDKLIFAGLLGRSYYTDQTGFQVVSPSQPSNLVIVTSKVTKD